ncbi:MAG: STAS domain-containing protein [Syntrophaceae bacterium]|nr:STAS domain-containing protein [Syntrophaceae bacterium]
MFKKRIPDKPRSYAIAVEGTPGEACTLFLSGRLALENLEPLLAGAETFLETHRPSSIRVDLSKVGYMDSAGALFIGRLRTLAAARSAPLELSGLGEDARRILSLVEGKSAPAVAAKVERPEGFFPKVAETAESLLLGFAALMTFVGEVVLALIHSLLHPRTVRWNAVLFFMRRAGVEGLPVVGLISLLLGLIMAFMASLQLRQFGANIYVASLVSIAIVRELGPIMTAILVAGRSGSAFAAEIGTMMVNEEVDALTTMGFDPIKFLVIPKVIAALVVVPVLTLYADLLGVLGGMIVGVTGLDITVNAYMTQTLKSIRIFDMNASMFKAMCFALLISGIVCYRGFQVRGGAEAVGAAATSAVVSAIFLIIVADSAFAIMLHYINP